MTIKPGKPADIQRGAYAPLASSSAAGKTARTGKTQANKNESTAPVAPQHEDAVALSQKAQEILIARQALLASPDVRAERIEEIQRNIRAGVYEHDAEKLADALIKKNIVDILA